ncbi:hypothetical protein [Haloarcula halophila]|uniref:hypothetical protein n=1 Tax=Haloarcula TaxID=2237 RepID=UPI0023E45DB5|nr:hypothetical protein [Halomicroarcula sp. DFY41]
MSLRGHSHTAFSVLVGLLVVSSTVASVGFVGIASAQSASQVTLTVDGTPEAVVVDTSNVTGQFTAEFRGEEDVLITRQKYDASTVNSDKLFLEGTQVYDSVSVTLTSENGGVSGATAKGRQGISPVNFGATVVGSTGGDADTQCDLNDGIGNAIGPYPNLDCSGSVADPGEIVGDDATDATQVKLDLYQSAQTSAAGTDNFQTTLDNYLNDTANTARIVGKNAYIRSLNNGSSKAAARTEAKSAVADYYAVKQKNLISAWEKSILTFRHLQNIAENESGITSYDYHQSSSVNFVHAQNHTYEGTTTYQYELKSIGTTQSLTLVNGDTANYTGYTVGFVDYDGGSVGSEYGVETLSLENPANSQEQIGSSAPDGGELAVRPPDPSNYDEIVVHEPEVFARLNADIESQNQQVQSEMDTLVNNTYSGYQKGEINNSDLIDPYAAARMGGNQTDAFNAVQLSSIGAYGPEALDQTGSHNVTLVRPDGTTVQREGVIFSPSNPDSGQWEVNGTYDLSNVSGTQYLATPNGTVALDDDYANLTLDRIETTDGETVKNFTTKEPVDYQTTSIDGYKDVLDRVSTDRAEAEAWENNRLGGGGSFIPGLSGSANSTIILLAGLVGVIWAIGQLT